MAKREPTAAPPAGDMASRRRGRNVALALALGGLVLLFYFVTLVKGPGVLTTGM